MGNMQTSVRDLVAAESLREWFCRHAITIELLLSAFKGLRAGGTGAKEGVSSYLLWILVQSPYIC